MLFAQRVISGIAQRCIYGQIALGYVLIYKGAETVSFAQAGLIMLGASGGLPCMTLFDFPFWLAVICAIGTLRKLGYSPIFLGSSASCIDRVRG